MAAQAFFAFEVIHIMPIRYCLLTGRVCMCDYLIEAHIRIYRLCMRVLGCCNSAFGQSEVEGALFLQSGGWTEVLVLSLYKAHMIL